MNGVCPPLGYYLLECVHCYIKKGKNRVCPRFNNVIPSGVCPRLNRTIAHKVCPRLDKKSI